MNWLRNSLIGGILIVLFLLVIRWNEFQERQIEISTAASDQTTLSSNTETEIPVSVPVDLEPPTLTENADIPSAPVDRDESLPSVPNATTLSAKSQLVHVQTDVLEVVIDTLGGDIVKVALPKHFAKLNTPDNPFVLLNRTQTNTYVAESGLVGINGTDGAQGRPTYSVHNTEFSLDENEDRLIVDLTLNQQQASIIKRFTFDRNSYLINVEYIIDNRASTPWSAAFYGQIRRDDHNPNNSTAFSMKPYLGAAITTPETNYKKISFDDLDDQKFDQAIEGGWVAMIQHYFLSAWVPDADSTNTFELFKLKRSGLYLLRFTSNLTKIEPNSTGSVKALFYAGPKNIRSLAAIAPHLDLTIDFGWLWMIAKPLFFALDYIHGLVGNWGIAIILLTCAIKLLFFYPSAMSYRSMAKMRKVQPLMAELKERYGDDRQKMSGELMKLYKKEKVNPLGGCLPVLLQMPVFLALYWTLMESVELRHAPFYLWIEDLSVRDPYFILPLLMGATMFIQQRLNPTPPDPMQAKIMQMMPIFFTALFMMFPAGLVLYWVVNNTLSISQQYVITKQIENS